MLVAVDHHAFYQRPVTAGKGMAPFFWARLDRTPKIKLPTTLSSPWWKRPFSRKREKGGLRALGGPGSVGSSRDTLLAPVLEPRPRLTGSAKTIRGPHRSPAGPAGFLCRRVDASRAPS